MALSVISVLFFVLSIFSLSSTAQELVTNGGLETGDATGWTVIGCDLANTYVGSVFPHSGFFDYELGQAGSTCSLQQSLMTSYGLTYIVSFWYAIDSSDVYLFQFDWEGTNYLNLNYDSYYYYGAPSPLIPYTLHSATLFAFAPPSTLAFVEENDCCYIHLDDVSVQQPAACADGTEVIPLTIARNPARVIGQVTISAGLPNLVTYTVTITDPNFTFGFAHPYNSLTAPAGNLLGTRRYATATFSDPLDENPCQPLNYYFGLHIGGTNLATGAPYRAFANPSVGTNYPLSARTGGQYFQRSTCQCT